MVMLRRRLNNSQTPIFLAVESGNIDAVRKLIAAGVKVNSLGWNNETLLHAAVRSNNLEMVQLLLDKEQLKRLASSNTENVSLNNADYQLDVNAANYSGSTPLHVLWRESTHSLSIARALIAAGSNVKALDTFQQSPLHIAATIGDAELIELLLNKDALKRLATGANNSAEYNDMDYQLDVNAPDNQGCTPLYLSAMQKNKAAVEKLITAGANL